MGRGHARGAVLTRRERIRLIRARLAELVASGEIARIASERPIPPPNAWTGISESSAYVRSLLDRAARVESGDAVWRATAHWRAMAELVARELERIAQWAGVSCDPLAGSR